MEGNPRFVVPDFDFPTLLVMIFFAAPAEEGRPREFAVAAVEDLQPALADPPRNGEQK